MPSPEPFTLHHLHGKQYLKRTVENALTLKGNVTAEMEDRGEIRGTRWKNKTKILQSFVVISQKNEDIIFTGGKDTNVVQEEKNVN